MDKLGGFIQKAVHPQSTGAAKAGGGKPATATPPTPAVESGTAVAAPSLAGTGAQVAHARAQLQHALNNPQETGKEIHDAAAPVIGKAVDAGKQIGDKGKNFGIGVGHFFKGLGGHAAPPPQ